MNDAPNGMNTKTEQLNQLVRAICVVILLLPFAFIYVWAGLAAVKKGESIPDSAAYIGILTLAITWFFKSRDEQQRKSDLGPGAKTTTTDTDPSGAKREVTQTAPPGAPAPAPSPLSPIATPVTIVNAEPVPVDVVAPHPAGPPPPSPGGLIR
jgi:hypothetical protein